MRPDLIRAVGKTVRVLVIRGLQEQFGRIGSACRDYDDAALIGFFLSIALDDDLGHSRARGIRIQLDDQRIGQEGDVGMLKRGANPKHFGVDFGVDEARKTVTVFAANAGAELRVAFRRA